MLCCQKKAGIMEDSFIFLVEWAKCNYVWDVQYVLLCFCDTQKLFFVNAAGFKCFSRWIRCTGSVKETCEKTVIIIALLFGITNDTNYAVYFQSQVCVSSPLNSWETLEILKVWNLWVFSSIGTAISPFTVSLTFKHTHT